MTKSVISKKSSTFHNVIEEQAEDSSASESISSSKCSTCIARCCEEKERINQFLNKAQEALFLVAICESIQQHDKKKALLDVANNYYHKAGYVFHEFSGQWLPKPIASRTANISQVDRYNATDTLAENEFQQEVISWIDGTISPEVGDNPPVAPITFTGDKPRIRALHDISNQKVIRAKRRASY